MEVIDVDALDAQALEAALDGAADGGRRQPLGAAADLIEADLGVHLDLAPQRRRQLPQRAADDFLGLAVVVGVGGVEHAQAGVEGAGDDASRLVLGSARAEVHAAEREERHGAKLSAAWRARRAVRLRSR